MSSSRKRVSPSTSSTRTRLWSASDDQPVEDLDAELRGRPADRLGASRSKPPTKTASRPSSRRSPSLEEVVAPGDRAAQRLLALGQVARAGRPGRRAGAPAGSRIASGVRSLTRAAASSIASGIPWSRAQIAATAGAFSFVTSKSGRTATRPGDEQANRLVLAIAVGGVEAALAARQVQLLELGQGEESRGAGRPGTGYSCSPETRSGGPARRDDREPRRGAQEVGDDRGAVDDLLEVVEDEQHLALGQPLDEHVAGRLGRRPRPGRASSRSATRPGPGRGPARAATNQTPSGNSSATSAASWSDSRVLPVPPGPGQGQQAGRREQRGGLGQLRLAADEARELGRQVVRPAIERADRRELGPEAVDDELAEPLRAGGP